MMIDHYFTGRWSGYSISHFLDPFQSIKVQTANHICLSYQLISKFLVTVVQQDILATRHPSQKIGKDIGYNHVYSLILWIQKMGKPQRRSYCIAIRRYMGYNHYFISTFKPFCEMIYLSLFYYFSQHNNYVSIRQWAMCRWPDTFVYGLIFYLLIFRKLGTWHISTIAILPSGKITIILRT